MINQNLVKHVKWLSKEMDNLSINVNKEYSKKKVHLLKRVYKILEVLQNQTSALPSYETFKKKFVDGSLSSISLKSSLYQIDSKVMDNPKSGQKLNSVHKCNILDNLFLLTPMMLMCGETESKKFLDCIAYANIIDSFNHQAELLLVMAEKKSQKKFKSETRKRFKRDVLEYNMIKKSMVKYF